VLVCALALAGCSSGPRPTIGTEGFVAGFLGGVVADEPNAAIIGRDVLSSGGSAADAAVAIGFAQAVTLPASAGLGSAGVCLLFDPAQRRLETIDFSPKAASRGRLGVPGLARGLAVLHARGGKLRWEGLLGPAERLARLGQPVSRATLGDIMGENGLGAVAPPFRPLFERATLGELITQPDLAVTLARLRQAGAGDFYVGSLARQIADGVAALQGDLTTDDLRAFIPQITPPLLLPFGNEVVAMPAPPAGAGGAITAQYLQLLLAAGWPDATPEARAHLNVEALRRALGAELGRRDGQPIIDAARSQTLAAGIDRARASPIEPLTLPEASAMPSAGFVVVDSTGSAVACTVTMVRRFGTGIQAPGTGVFIASAPQAPSISLAPVLLVNTRTFRFFGAFAGMEGRAAAPAAVLALLGSITEGRTLEVVLSRPRLFAAAGPVELEPEAIDSAAALEDRGHALQRVPLLGRVHGLVCLTGVPTSQPVCDLRADPRSAGLAVGAQ
jgi:gamma-glutamyltranspeptidase/glutathione hydrolase